MANDQAAVHLTLVFDRTQPFPDTSVFSFNDAHVVFDNFDGVLGMFTGLTLLPTFHISDSHGSIVQQRISEKLVKGNFSVI